MRSLHGFLGNIEPDRQIERRVMPLQNRLQAFRLRDRARKSIEHKPVPAMQAQPVFDQFDDDLVRNQSAMLRGLGRLESRAACPRSLSRRRIAPGEVTGIPNCRVIISAWVPFPEPGAPRSTSRLFT